MKRYIISFKSKEDVIDFLRSINPEHVEFSMKTNIVICTCSDDELLLAKTSFGAEVDELLKV